MFINISDRLSEGKKPPDEIIVIDKLRELKLRILNKLRIIKITKVIDEYKRKILKDCFKVSALLNDIKLVIILNAQKMQVLQAVFHYSI